MGFNTIQLCHSMLNFQESGYLQVNANRVTWKVFISNGHLQYAVHSLQSLDTLTHYLDRLGHGLSASMRKRLIASIAGSSWDVSLLDAIDRLEKQGILNPNGIKAIKLALSKDALEPLLWLSEANHSWTPHHSRAMQLKPLATILDELESRLQSWQQLQPVVRSPYQQISCPDSSNIHKPVPNGQLNQALLSMLTQLMQGNSIYHIAFLLKQDSLKVAQLLFPYIQQQIFILASAVSPLSRLPNVPMGISPQMPSQQLPPPPLKKVPKIVCIDDSPAMLDTLRTYLGAEGFDVATVENPMESMSTLFAMKPDLILMDVSMPGINGRRLCKILRRSSAFKKLPIIIVSSNASSLDQAKAESSGATDYLKKPFSKGDLLTLVNTYLRGVTPV